MPRPYGRRDTDSARARDLRNRMAANRRKRERLEAALAELDTTAAQLAGEARGELTYEAIADALGVSRAKVGYMLTPDRAAG